MSSILKVIKAFKKDAEYLPVEYPTFPKLETVSEKPTEAEAEKIREAFQAYEKEFYKIDAEISARFEVAMERIKLCSLLTGMLNPLSQTPINDRSHFKWCPHHQWINFSRAGRNPPTRNNTRSAK